jgi:hypothetical protein
MLFDIDAAAQRPFTPTFAAMPPPRDAMMFVVWLPADVPMRCRRYLRTEALLSSLMPIAARCA